ncbi:hypothetical protein EWE75_12060 [Sphingomonas populi]|uniref:Tape measure protein N-terminal domain-containing protein n=1 Tax=Sphingomonas populi TaxID=2484750 RepID=A0A4Q6XUL0_9SPHN|nr:tape measure protein [Sphingomonas populi]RZF64273.1 hypothetical protein EWE75_12060 [Sphingomonas populi]
MADSPDIRQLLLQVDATTELLRRNLDRAVAEVGRFQQGAQRSLDATDRGFNNLGRGIERIVPAIDRTNARITSIGATTVRIQHQVEASSNAIATAFTRAGGALAAVFAVDKVKEYADGYTRFTNSLRVANLEGARLTATQEALFATAQKYGVNVEAIGDLYGRAAQAAHGIGATDGDVLKFSNAVAAAVKVQGGSAESAKDTIIQLGQALDSGVVHAQEYNSVTTGLYPLLQAVAATSDKYAGSVANIRKEMLAGKLTSADFFAEIVKAQEVLEKRAGSANLTISASLQVLDNALGRYIGQTDESLSATARFGGGIKLLADNLDTVLPALTSIAVAYGAVKAGSAVLAGADLALGAQRGTIAAILQGNAAYVDQIGIRARLAVAAQAEAAAEVTAIERTIAARAAERAALQESIVETNALAAAKRAEAAFAANSNINNTVGRTAAIKAQVEAENRAAFAAQRVADMRARQTVVTVELAAAEQELAIAQARAAVAAEAAAAATAAATIGARAAALASSLFAGALNLVTGAVPLIAIAALVGAIIHYSGEAGRAQEQTRAFTERHKEAAAALERTSIYGRAAATAIAQSGSAASTAAGGMARFAGAVGQAAANLRELARQRKQDALQSQADVQNNAQKTIREASSRIAGRQYAQVVNGVVVARGSSDSAADAADRAAIAKAQQDQASARTEYNRLKGLSLPVYAGSDATGGVDIPQKLLEMRNDLRIAQAGGNKSDINKLKAQVYELTQYQAYRKAGLSDETARSKSSEDAEQLRAAGQSKIDAGNAKAGAAAGRRADAQAKAEARRQAAAVKDEAADTRAYMTAERQANDALAAAHADLTNSAAERAQIERDRVEADRKNRNDELAEQAKQGRFGDPKTAAARVKALQDLNDRAAIAQTAVINLKEQRQKDDDAAALAAHQIDIKRDSVGVEEQLATTAKDRAAKELELLDLQKQEEKIRLERILAANSGASQGERAQAKLDYDTLDDRYAVKQTAVAVQNAGPMEQYRRQLSSDVGDLGTAFDGLKTDAIKGVADDFQSAAVAALHLHGVLGTVLSDLIKIGTEKLILSIIGAPLGLSTGGKIPGKATGGKISGEGTGTSDSIFALIDGRDPLMVSNGESIVNERATREYWPVIDAMNRGTLRKRIRGLAAGGRINPAALVQPSVPDMRAIGEAQRAAIPPQFIYVAVDKSELFDVHVQRAAAPLAQAAIVSGSQMAQQESAEAALQRIPT